ncbi:MAG: CDF family Co(II)/Ni(II) efflux transporter DmeF [Blastomonas fulva]|uniref:CDF family Co(II)/Ni(II) efflux transporter DmeF n=1 Tax=Blastomonas fulva TaxID=1550728 RepID=UPI0024E1C57F|nr:CDF family Co(II)/Ni(II) efflux transporter DmeF [Blastomonas fulva]MDK2757437.1 CDF family Co(II)/Ni(II) efflux transporter DmeF [Blastomonas fulva]
MHHDAALEQFTHDHRFAADGEARSEQRTLWVVALTAVTMIAEILGGWWTGSMALLADGWHMGSHVAALGLAAFAYRFARTHAHDLRFSMGTGKVGSLTGFSSALLLGVIALLMIWESADRLADPVAIDYTAAIVVTLIGLAVNVASAFMLSSGGHHHHHHDHDGDHHHHHHGHHHDHNLRAAYIHVLTDALTSGLALVALTGGLMLGLDWLDPLMGIVGAVVILWWARGLLRECACVLLDMEADPVRAETIRKRIEADADNRVVDLHLWQVGTGHLALIVSLATHNPRPPQHYRALLRGIGKLSHCTFEVIPCDDARCPPAD